ncbi:hypothetical protein [Conchiformibius kuhniae]|uniref:Uncharacterized protein n=1 Tax=Conchiformibius kuhniae TaxID=211502 RepID=A0A8T9MQB4_9NEIS|nr:hypothetical protein [Conchiformibius kuhniae]UOP04090.1 hypothetical protein LVJ77_06320 [Conchiformibius kuhniae]
MAGLSAAVGKQWRIIGEKRRGCGLAGARRQLAEKPLHRHFRADGKPKQVQINLEKILRAGCRTVDSRLRGHNGIFVLC